MRSRFKLGLAHVLPAVACFGVALGLTRVGWLERLENVSVDARTVLRAKVKPVPPPEDVALIAIDEASMRQFGVWPWPRDRHGDLMTLLGRTLPSVVAWDLLFTEPSEASGLDERFAAGIEASGASVMLGAMRADKEDGAELDEATVRRLRLSPLTRVAGDRSQIPGGPAALLPTDRLAGKADIGFVDTPPDADGIRRVAPLVVRVGEGVYPTLALRALMLHWGVEPDQVEVRLGEAIVLDNGGVQRRIPVDARGGYAINYRYSIEHRNITAHGYSWLDARLRLKFEHGQAVKLPDVTGKILVIGQTAEGLADMGPTPFSALTPLVLVHANVLGNILAEDYVRRLPAGWVWAGAFVLGVVGMVRFSERKFWEQAVFSLGVPVAYVATATAAWIQGSWLLPVVGPLAGFGALQVFMIGRRVLVEQRAKEQIKGMFGTYLSPQLVKRMVDSGEMPRLGGHEEEITAYFSDIQGFSTFSEKMAPDRLVELMNEYLTACTDIVQEEGGTLDKYIGDAVVAMFGAPVALPDHAYRACVASQRVHLKLAELRAKWRSEGDKWPQVVWQMQSRIGLNTGRCIIGNMGSRTRFNYTMMGDDVNLAARMESGAKKWGAYTLCTDATKLACERHGDRVVFRPLGRIVVKGRTRAVPIYEVTGLKEHLASTTAECIAVFSDGLEHYYQRDWARAEQRFNESATLEPNQPGTTSGVTSNPSLVYLDIVRRYRAEPPPAEWDGVYVMTEK